MNTSQCIGPRKDSQSQENWIDPSQNLDKLHKID